jgi:DNA-binding IclR family transcriptional regulator
VSVIRTYFADSSHFHRTVVHYKNMNSDQTGSLRRAMAIMRVLANVNEQGAGLTDIAYQAGLPHPTAHRVLAQMLEEGMVRRAEDGRKYALGPLTFELGLAAARQLEVRHLYRPIIAQLASETGDTAYLTVRSGLEAVCVDRRQGASPVQVIALKIGSRRPLGVGAGGLAIVAGLPEQERAEVIRSVAPDLEANWKTPEPELREIIEQIRRDGYTLIRNRVFQGVSALGHPVRDSRGNPVAAVSLATINQRMRPARVRELNEYLHCAVRKIETTATALSAASDLG